MDIRIVLDYTQIINIRRFAQMKRLILTVMMIMITTIIVGCGKDNAPQVTNDLLYRETNEVHKVSEISQYL